LAREALSPPGRLGTRRATEPAAEIGARLSQPRLPGSWLSAVVTDLHADRVIAGAAVRIRRDGIFFLDLVAAEHSDLQLVFADARAVTRADREARARVSTGLVFQPTIGYSLDRLSSHVAIVLGT
jgi:hypothetical protein